MIVSTIKIEIKCHEKLFRRTNKNYKMQKFYKMCTAPHSKAAILCSCFY
ncbi:hypothetical protein KL86DES1_21964 [uncultured Desulfovibrio sp.]|uniref:Uncharacterized protein n=1 Tax=uncultured Desulfovibrio sp. TaxID=167968 RepID=A0A212LAB1_9BACT|nr:hypothetical protein KL86DES1_21964 [uncultured Desulfovibrio sp.]VZH34857.1 conserved protein of unknown function [Desulfovibrio sp. 86]